MEEEKVEIVYPYLAQFKSENEKDRYVVLFLEEDRGIVLVSEREDIKFGQEGSFDETLFEVTPPNYVVRLNN